MYEAPKKHPMEHDYEGYQEAMNNAQKPQPDDPDKKQSNDNAVDSYTGEEKKEMNPLDMMAYY